MVNTIPIANQEQAMSSMSSILIADDSVSLCHRVIFILKEAKYIVVQAINGLEALREATNPENNFGLILIGEYMQEINGLTLVRILRTYPNCETIPIIIFRTPWSMQNKLTNFILYRAGVTWLPKRLITGQLLIVVDAAMGKAKQNTDK